MRIRQPYEPGGVSRQEIHAREPGPLAVRDEQLVRLLRLDPAPAHRGHELHEAEVAREAALEAPETLEADHADRPRPEAALALEAPRRRIGRDAAQTLEVERSAEADECGRAPAAEAVRRELRGRQPSQVGPRRRRV
jgi:hypothetical protein